MVEGSFGDNGQDGTDCQDYILQKMQNSETPGHPQDRNDAGQTYTTVKESITTTEQELATWLKHSETPPKWTTAEAAERNADSTIPMNILTVRCRWNKADVKLSYAIKKVQKKFDHITRFHCGFCRGLVGQTRPP